MSFFELLHLRDRPQTLKLNHLVQHNKQHNKLHHRKGLLHSIRLNGPTLGFYPQTQNLKPTQRCTG